MPGVKGEVEVKKTGTTKKVKYKFGETSAGVQRGIQVGAKSYSLRGEGDKPGKEVNVHKSGAYVGKESAFYKELALVIADYHVQNGTWPPKGVILVGRAKTKVIIEPK